MQGRIVQLGQGIWGPHFDPPYAIVGIFLRTDVGRSIAVCDSYVDDGLDVAEGNQRTFEVQGNHIILRTMPTWVLLRDLFGGKEQLEPAVISMEAYLSVLRYWLSIVRAWDRHNPPIDSPGFVYKNPHAVPPLSPEEADRAFVARVRGCG